jgi:flagellar protein FlaI
MVKTTRRFETREELDLLIKKLIVFSGRKEIKKINNVELAEIKGRANIVFSPFGPQVTITRAKERPLYIVDLNRAKSIDAFLGALFWLYLEGMGGIKCANILISGGPGTGKTTLLNALLNFFPENDRVVVIEDTLELNTELEENCSRLESDDENSLADLVRNSLRMRPDRIVVGEVRGREAQDLMTAMNIGKYCLGTLHANTARETVIRLTSEPMNVPQMLINLVNVILIMRRYVLDGKVRRVVSEVVETAGMEKETVLLSTFYGYDVATNEFKDFGVSSLFRDKIAQVSGKTPREVLEELHRRTVVLQKMADRGVSDFREVTALCRQYIIDPWKVYEELLINKKDFSL